MKTPDDVAEMLRLKACGWGLGRLPPTEGRPPACRSPALTDRYDEITATSRCPGSHLQVLGTDLNRSESEALRLLPAGCHAATTTHSLFRTAGAVRRQNSLLACNPVSMISGEDVNVMSPVPMNGPPSPGQNLGTGNFVRSISRPVSTTSFTGARSLAIIVGAIGSRMIERVASIISGMVAAGSSPTAIA